MSGPIVVAGARGFVGNHLVERLLAEGRTVRSGTRSPDKARERWPDRDWVALDLDDPTTLPAALKGADTLVYLVHLLGQGAEDLHAREKAQAREVLEACEQAGVRRIVFLGGPMPKGTPSPHLAARHATGEMLRSGTVSCIELRAAMIIGAGSESWQICRDLALRLPVMIAPKWTDTLTQPIGIDDVVLALTSAIDDPLEGSGAFDLPGPETLSAVQILRRVAAQVEMGTVVVPVPLLTPRLSSLWLRFVTRADYAIARQLVDGLTDDLVADGSGYWERVDGTGAAPTSLDEAIHQALADERPPEGMERVLEGLARRVGKRTKRKVPDRRSGR